MVPLALLRGRRMLLNRSMKDLNHEPCRSPGGLTVHNPTSLHDEGWKATARRETIYQDPTAPARKRLLDRALKHLPRGNKVLDYGCGRGEFTEYIASLGFRVVGVDLSAHAIAFNRKDFPNLEFLEVGP